jgi:hypothetical protein
MPRRKNKQTRPENPIPLTEDQAVVAQAVVEEAPLVKKWVSQEQIIAVRMTLGENPPIPEYVLLGALPCCRAKEDGSDPEIILQPDSPLSVFMHEYAHWLAFTFCPELVVKAGRDKNERWASLVQTAYDRQASLMYPRRSCLAFYTAGSYSDE